MGFLDINTQAAVEPSIADAGEAKLRIIGYVTDENDNAIRKDKNGNNYFMPLFEIVDNPTAKELNDFMGLPSDSMTDKERNKSLWKVASFEKCFSIEECKDHNESIGHEGYVMLGQRTNKMSGEEENFIKRYM